MKEQQIKLLTKVANGEITPENAQTELWNLFSVMGSFSIDDIKVAYNMGRSDENIKSISTSDIIEEAWLYADVWDRNIKWD